MKDIVKCEAKNPATCWRHGTGLGFDANRSIKELYAHPNPYTRFDIHEKSLKTFDAPHLAEMLLSWADQTPGVSVTTIRKAVLLAADVHRTDTRANRAAHTRTPYIEHPLRNSIRIIRYGIEDQDQTVAALLHDTVEDHPYELAERLGVTSVSENEARKYAYQYIRKTFGPRVMKIVKGMSNPILPEGLTTEQKHEAYAEHFFEAIQNPDVLINKTSDFTDNALSLHHTQSGMNPAGLQKRATKYLQVIDPLISTWKKAYVMKTTVLPDTTVSRIIEQLERGKIMLNRMVDQTVR